MANSRCPRILCITPLPPPVHGSAVISEQIRKSKVINEEFECDFINISASKSMHEIQSFTVSKIIRVLSIYINLLYKLLTRRYDLCYCAIACFGVPFIKDTPVVLLCKLFGRPVLIHQHNKGMSKYCTRKVYRLIYRWVYENTKVALLSWRLYDDVKFVVQKDQVVILPNGLPAIDMQQYSNESDICHFFFLSNLIITKGCNDLLAACEILIQRGVLFKCDFVGGDSPEQSAEQFEKLIKDKRLSEYVCYKGKLYGDAKEQMFRDADVFVFPTYYPQECFPLVLLEAMQFELACITTAEGAIPDIITDRVNGIICESRNVEQIANAMQWMVEHPKERKQMGQIGKDIFDKSYSLSVFERNFCGIIKKVVSTN